MDPEKIKELNALSIFFIQELMRKGFEDLDQISLRDYTFENPTLGYSLGFHSRDLKATFTLYLYAGDTFPITPEAFKRYHLYGVTDILSTYPDMRLQDEEKAIEYSLATDEILGHLKTTLEKANHPVDELVVISTYFSGILIKIRATFEKDERYRYILDNFQKELSRNLSEIFLKLNSENQIVSAPLDQ